MPYIDESYYRVVYKGIEVDASIFLSLEARASDLIDRLTSHKIVMSNNKLADYPVFIQEQVKKATAAQVEYLVINGGETAVHGGAPSSVNIGNFSYQEGTDNQIVSPSTIGHLQPTGLLYRGVSVYGG
jgi:hypothetical protein